MIGIYIGFGLMTLAALLALYENRRIRKVLYKSIELNREQNKHIEEQLAHRLSEIFSRSSKAEIEETTAGIPPKFTVYRKGYGDTRHEIISFYYNPADPDDRDYKRIHAEEVAEMLNERL